MRKWLDKLFGRTKTLKQDKARAFKRPVGQLMTLQRWQEDNGLITWARTSPEFAYILCIAFNHQPVGFPVRGEVVTDIQCAIELGRKEGYADLMSILLALMDTPKPSAPEIPADYDNTEYAETQQR